jgi:hypothetical protein
MIEEHTILAAERLRDELTDFKSTLRKRYHSNSQVTSDELRRQAATLAQKWLVDLGTDDEINLAIGDPIFADLNVHFQRLLTFSEHATKRARYDGELRSILNNYSTLIVLPLKQMRGKDTIIEHKTQKSVSSNSIFVGLSFDPADVHINRCICDTFTALGLSVVTGEKPKADRISEKVKSLIEQQSIFAGIFTRRDKVARKPEWTTSAWVIDEKAYAVGLQKRLILLKEQGVNSIGGIQGDYEYIEFSREALERTVINLIKLFGLTNNGLLK